jgi:hypothetical protein
MGHPWLLRSSCIGMAGCSADHQSEMKFGQRLFSVRVIIAPSNGDDALPFGMAEMRQDEMFPNTLSDVDRCTERYRRRNSLTSRNGISKRISCCSGSVEGRNSEMGHYVKSAVEKAENMDAVARLSVSLTGDVGFTDGGALNRD